MACTTLPSLTLHRAMKVAATATKTATKLLSRDSAPCSWTSSWILSNGSDTRISSCLGPQRGSVPAGPADCRVLHPSSCTSLRRAVAESESSRYKPPALPLCRSNFCPECGRPYTNARSRSRSRPREIGEQLRDPTRPSVGEVPVSREKESLGIAHRAL